MTNKAKDFDLGELAKSCKEKFEIEIKKIERDYKTERNEIYRIENFKMSVKDFELIALASVLEIDFNDIKNIIIDKSTNNKVVTE